MDKTFCIFGDSVAQAAYVKKGWVDMLREYLEEKYKDNFVNVFNLGVGGNTTADILKRFASEATARNPTATIFRIQPSQLIAEILIKIKLVTHSLAKRAH